MRVARLFAAILISLAGCSSRKGDDHAQKDKSGSVAREIGKGAYKASEEAGKAAKTIGKELGKGIKEASEGWKEARRESKAKRKK